MPSRQHDAKDNIKFSAILQFSVGPLLSIGIIVVPLAFVATGLDPFRYILEEILEDPIYRSSLAIVGAVVIRYILLLIASVETFRCVAYLYTITLVGLIRWKDIMIAPVFWRNASKFCQIHIEYRLLIKSIQSVGEAIIFLVLTFVFWIIVFLAWAVVKCSPERIGYILYAWFATALCLLCFGAAVLLSLICKLLDLDSIAVQVNILMAKRDFVFRRNWQNRITVRRTMAVRPIRLKFGTFAYFGREFFVSFIFVLLCRSFDAIIIFDY